MPDDVGVQHGTPNGLVEDIREVIDDDVRQMREKLNAKKQLLEQMGTERAKEVCQHSRNYILRSYNKTCCAQNSPKNCICR